MKAKFRGIFLTAENPAVTAKFYREVAGLSLEESGEDKARYWKVDEAGMQLAIHSARLFAEYAYPPEVKSNLTHLYFKIAEQKAFYTHLKKLGVAVYCADEVVITVLDPDGRKVMFGIA